MSKEEIDRIIYQAQSDVAAAWLHCKRLGAIGAGDKCRQAIERLTVALRMIRKEDSNAEKSA